MVGLVVSGKLLARGHEVDSLSPHPDGGTQLNQVAGALKMNQVFNAPASGLKKSPESSVLNSSAATVLKHVAPRWSHRIRWHSRGLGLLEAQCPRRRVRGQREPFP